MPSQLAGTLHHLTTPNKPPANLNPLLRLAASWTFTDGMWWTRLPGAAAPWVKPTKTPRWGRTGKVTCSPPPLGDARGFDIWCCILPALAPGFTRWLRPFGCCAKNGVAPDANGQVRPYAGPYMTPL